MTVVNTVQAAVSGIARQGQVLSTSQGSWTFDLDYLSYTYRWLRCDAAGSNCVAISGATNPSYLLTAADVGFTLRSEVTATEHTGTYPASFYTGPLGSNNPVPADTAGALLIMWSGVTGNTSQQQRDFHAQRMADCGRTWDGVQFQGTGLDVGGSLGEDWIHSYGMLPIHTWNPGASTATILAGGANAAIDAEINRMKAHSYVVMIRLMHEFNEAGTAYYGLANPTQFVAAWRYIVNRFHTQGANNVGFWWCPSERMGNPERANINACYPGDAYVDWIGSDRYNTDDGFSWPYASGWATFDQIVHYDYYTNPSAVSMYTQWSPVKPFVIGETGTKYSGSDANRKANWFREVDSVGKAHMPNLRGVAFFDIDTIPDEPHDWRVDHNQTAAQGGSHGSVDAVSYQGFKDLAAVARWNVGRVGG